MKYYGMFGVYEMIGKPSDPTKAYITYRHYKVVDNRQTLDNGVEDVTYPLEFSHTLNLKSGKGYVYLKKHMGGIVYNPTTNELLSV